MVLIVAYYPLPEGSAGSERIKSLARLAAAADFKPIIIGKTNGRNVRGDIDGIPFIAFGDTSRLRTYLSFGKKVIAEAKKIAENDEIDAIILGTSTLLSEIQIRNYAHRNGIPLIKDVVEWYSPSQFRLGRLAFPYIEKSISNRLVDKKRDRVIAISEYLEQHYASAGVRTIRIPIFFKQDEYSSLALHKAPGSTSIIYAGSPGKKDYLHIVIQSLFLLPHELLDGNKLKIHLAGVSDTQVKTICNETALDYHAIEHVVEAYGRISRDEVLKLYRQSDFSILIRDGSQRYAKAGFPSKIVESLSMGVPPICNFTSDLAMYLRDGQTCIEVEDCNAEACADALKRVLELSPEKTTTMKTSAKELATRQFNIDSFVPQFREIMNS